MITEEQARALKPGDVVLGPSGPMKVYHSYHSYHPYMRKQNGRIAVCQGNTTRAFNGAHVPITKVVPIPADDWYCGDEATFMIEVLR